MLAHRPHHPRCPLSRFPTSDETFACGRLPASNNPPLDAAARPISAARNKMADQVLAHLPFEYKLAEKPRLANPVELSELLNAHGAEGWVLCGSDYGYFVFMRPSGL